MPKPKQREISLDDILAKERRADATRKAAEIMGSAARRHSNPSLSLSSIPPSHPTVPTGPRRRGNPTSGSGFGAASRQGGNSSGSGGGVGGGVGGGRDLHSRINAGRVGKPAGKPAGKVTEGKVVGAVNSKLAKQMQANGNKLFAALHGDQASIRGAVGGGIGGDGGGNVAIRGQGQQQPQPQPQQQQQQQQRRSPPQVQPPVQQQPKIEPTGGFQIRGAAGPAVVQASNFAPGTTAEDIRHAMKTIGKILSCIILTVTPSVIAEIVFETKKAGDKCIELYHGKRADGRVLQVMFKNSPPVFSQQQRAQRELTPGGSRDPFAEREEADRRRREQNIHFQDGRYGLKPPPMYSDALLQRGRGFQQ